MREAARAQMKKHRRRRADARVRERRALYEERRASRGTEKREDGGTALPESLNKRTRLHKEAMANRVYTQMRWY